MAAKEEAYTGLSFFTGDCEHLVAKLDTDYDTMKLRFYLDDVVATKEGVVGCVTSGGVNEQMHNMTTRKGKGRVGNLILLNDGGLNTLGTVSLGTVSFDIVNGIILPITYRNAYYVDGDAIKVRYKKNSDTIWTEYFVKGNTPKAEFTVFNGTLTSVSGDLSPNDLVYIQIQTINAEGTFTSSTATITLPYPSLVMAYGGYASTAFSNYGSNTDKAIRYFSEYDVAVGVFVSDDEDGFINLPAGYYANTDFWMKVELNTDPMPKSVITKIGAIGTWDTGDPSTADYGTVTWYHRGTPIENWATSCALISADGSNTPVTIYYKYSNDRWYNDTTLTTLATDGNYYTDKTHFQVIVSGQYIGDGDCTGGPIIE